MHRLFKDSPARRSDYTEITGSNQFPLKLCTTRWVENVSVSQRAIAVFDNIEKYVKSSKLPSTVTASAVKEAVEDPLTLAKLAFFGSVAGMVEPFLRRFQTDSPMVPFLYDELQRIMRKLMQRFIKSSELKKADTVKKLMKLNLEANLCTYKEVDIGVQASSTLNKSKVSEKMKMGFRIDCVKYLTAMVEKLRERCPLKYRLTRLSSALSPHTILRNASVGKQRLSELVQLLHECGKVSAVCADQAKLQYSDLCDMAETDLKDQFKEFDPYDNAQSLDTFFVTLLGNNKDQDALFEVMKIICTLSHGNAQVESGFSINGDVLVTNMQEESVVAQRQVYDAIHASGGLLNVDINASLMSFVRSSHSAYDDALKKKQQQQSEEEKRRIEKRKASEMIKELKAKKLKLNEDAKAESLEIQRKIDSLSKITKS